MCLKGALGLLIAGTLMVFAPPAWAGFGFAEKGFTVAAINPDGTPDTQAGSHPFEYITVNAVKKTIEKVGEEENIRAEGGIVRDIEVELPPGLVGDPGAISQCPVTKFHEQKCPADSQIGLNELELSGFVLTPEVYNLVPPRGAPAEFGFVIPLFGVPIVLTPRVRTGSDYGVSVLAASIPEGFSLISSNLTLWGVPADPRHNRYRGGCWDGFKNISTGENCPSSAPPRPFLSLPTSCTGPLRFTSRIDSWEAPGSFVTAKTTIPGMTGCDRLDFNPEVVVAPEPEQAASPSGLSVEIRVPQTYDNAEGLAEANLKDTVVTLPVGVGVNSAAADGLVACTPEEFGLENANEPSCPDAAKVGSVEITTPLLGNPLRGGVYLAQQGNLPGNGSNPFGSLIALYLTVKDPYSGVLVKVAGEVRPDPVTGQLTTTFSNNPQVPFNSLRLSFFGGPRAALVNPPVCGAYTTTTEMSPWSGGAAASPSWTFQVAAGPGGVSCQGLQQFHPQFTAGTKNNQAGGFSQFSLTYYRTDADQNLGRIEVQTPPGLLGVLSDIALCEEPQAAKGTCGSQSLIGHVTVGVGAGSNPFYVTGQMFLTGPYHGAPFGLSIVVPAIAGPYNLGTVVVRASVNVDVHTAALTVVSDPLPQILQGIPLLVRAVNVTVDREGFIFNPTDCNPTAIAATLSGALGASVSFSERFQVTNCAALGFKPKFTVSTSGHTSRAAGASLDAKLVYPGVGGRSILATRGGAANIARVKVDLPKQLPSRLTTLQKACPAATFEANPSRCPAASVVGIAKATTPLLPVTLVGPAYFVSNGGQAFPNLIVVLQGYGVRVDLVGSTFISKAGITSSTFKSVPDVPVATFEIYLPQGPYSALAANGNLCAAKLTMPTAFVAQNGMEIHQSTPIAVTGCAKAKKARKARGARRAKRAGKAIDKRPASSGKRR